MNRINHFAYIEYTTITKYKSLTRFLQAVDSPMNNFSREAFTNPLYKTLNSLKGASNSLCSSANKVPYTLQSLSQSSVSLDLIIKFLILTFCLTNELNNAP